MTHNLARHQFTRNWCKSLPHHTTEPGDTTTQIHGTSEANDTKSKPGSTTRYSSPENGCVGIVETTTQREETIPILTTFDEGGLPHESFVSSWNPVTFKERGSTTSSDGSPLELSIRSRTQLLIHNMNENEVLLMALSGIAASPSTKFLMMPAR